MINYLKQSQNLDVTLSLDGKQIARSAARYINDEINTITARQSRLKGVY